MAMFGAFVGNDPSHLTAFENWLGRPVDNILSYFNDAGWKGFDSSINYGLDLWEHSGRPVIWGVPLTVKGTSLADVAAGGFEEYHRKAAEAVAESREGDDGPIYIRLGWEFNGDWMPWAAAGQEKDFINAFRQVSDVFDSVSDRFKIVWDVNIGGGNLEDPSTAYPGDAYVDVVGLDLYYNTQWDSKDPEAAFEYSVSRPFGLDWVADFAAAHGKPLAVSEWGIESESAGPFIENFNAWMTEHDVLYANYWESNAGGFHGQLRDGAYADAGEHFKDLYGHTGEAQPDTLVLQVSADSFHGDPRFTVFVDGHQVGGVHTTGASHAQGLVDTITLHGDFGDDPQNVEIRFLNDGWGGHAGLDRNLYVKQVSLNGHSVSGGDAINTAGVNKNGTAAMLSAGKAVFELQPDGETDTLTFRVSGDSYKGDPVFTVSVDGKQVGGAYTAQASHAAGHSETITLRGDFGDDPRSVAFTFLEDAWGGRADLDRNLYVEHVSLNGHGLSGNEAVNEAGSNTKDAAVLANAGTATFDFASASIDTLKFRVSGDSFQGDPQFTVSVDGQQIGGVLTAKASHASRLSETITLEGDFGDDPQSVVFTFLEDAWGGRADLDRNLYIEHVSLNGEVVSGSKAVNTAGANTADAAALNIAGTASFDFGSDAYSDALTLRVSADSYWGDPQFTVKVDGNQVGGIMTAQASHAAGQSDTITLYGDFGDDPQALSITFLNDAWGGTSDQDRNLYLEDVSLNGQSVSGDAVMSKAASNTGGPLASLFSAGTATILLPSQDDWMV